MANEYLKKCSMSSVTTKMKIWAFLMAQMVKNVPTMQETGVRFLGWEDSLENEVSTHCRILAQGSRPSPRNRNAKKWLSEEAL